jgi:O-acetyl-ADP-ribose deacetylase (regulator of RNase III)
MARSVYKNAWAHQELNPGECVVAQVQKDLWIISMVGQHGLGPTSLQHNWLGAALHNLAANAIQYNASVHMPRIGCGLAGGSWEDVEPLILAAFNCPLARFVPVTVYDQPK